MLDVTLAPRQRFHRLTIFPLVTDSPAELPYTLLADALTHGTLRITELDQATVGTLLAQNDGDADVLILDGEQLIGARQNRMTNRTLLLPAHSKTEIPVSCMEQGRWRHATSYMAPTAQHSPSKVRKHVRATEARHAMAGGGPSVEYLRAAQADVWGEIHESAATLGAHSPTSALDELYQARRDLIEGGVSRFPRVDNQVGLLAFLGDRPLGVDVIGGRALYARLHERLLRGYLMDAATEPGFAAPDTGPTSAGQPAGAHRVPGTAPDDVAAQAFLDVVRASRRVEAPTVGRGTYSVLSGEVVGGELVDGARLAHLSAFPALERDDHRGGQRATVFERPIAPPSRRRGL